MQKIKEQIIRQVSATILISLATLPLISGCGMNKNIEDAKGLNNIRAQAIRDSAVSYGARYGLAVRTKVINSSLKKQQKQLDRIFNFNAMLLPHNLLPPVLAESRRSLNLAGPDVLRLSDRIYKIVTPAHFVTAPPSWRDYLWLNYDKPDEPDVTLLPRTQEERDLWNEYVQMGWKDGARQADQIFLENLGHLKRDFTGMSIYRVLLAKNMVSAPFVAKARLGITGNETELRINDEVLRITATANLRPNAKDWEAALEKDDLPEKAEH